MSRTRPRPAETTRRGRSSTLCRRTATGTLLPRYDTNGNPVTITAPDGEGSQVSETTQQSTSLDQTESLPGRAGDIHLHRVTRPRPGDRGRRGRAAGIGPAARHHLDAVRHGRQRALGNHGGLPAGGQPGLIRADHLPAVQRRRSPSTAPASVRRYRALAHTGLRHHQRGRRGHPARPRRQRRPNQQLHPGRNANGQTATTTYAFDGDGEQTSTTGPDGNLTGANAGNYTTTTAYNADGQQSSRHPGRRLRGHRRPAATGRRLRPRAATRPPSRTPEATRRRPPTTQTSQASARHRP